MGGFENHKQKIWVSSDPDLWVLSFLSWIALTCYGPEFDKNRQMISYRISRKVCRLCILFEELPWSRLNSRRGREQLSEITTLWGLDWPPAPRSNGWSECPLLAMTFPNITLGWPTVAHWPHGPEKISSGDFLISRHNLSNYWQYIPVYSCVFLIFFLPLIYSMEIWTMNPDQDSIIIEKREA